jgi:hypothetical protein
MRDTRADSEPDSSKDPDGIHIGNETLLGTLILLMKQQRADSSGQEATKALKGLVNKVGMFDGKT